MGPIFAENTLPRWRNCWNFPFRGALLFSVWLTGCNSTCFTFTSKPPTGTIDIKAGDPKPSCALSKANGAVRLTVQTVPMCSPCSGSSRVQHVFVSIRGIEIHPSTTADDDSPDWQELLPPKLVEQPLQVDLVGGTADRGARKPLGEIVAFIPPDTDTDLVIELTPVWSWVFFASEGVRLLPSLTGSAKVGRVEFDELGTPEDGVVHDSLSRLAHD